MNDQSITDLAEVEAAYYTAFNTEPPPIPFGQTELYMQLLKKAVKDNKQLDDGAFTPEGEDADAIF